MRRSQAAQGAGGGARAAATGTGRRGLLRGGARLGLAGGGAAGWWWLGGAGAAEAKIAPKKDFLGGRDRQPNDRYVQGQESSPGLAAEEVGPPFQRSAALGVPYQELAEGSGPEVAKAGDLVVIDYVLRRANGYFIYGTVEGVSFQPKDVPTEPFRFTLGDADVIQGLQDVVTGMRVGGRRRALVKPEFGYGLALQPQMPTFATRRQLETYKNQPLLFEIDVVRIRKAAG